jgi:hypothetical protein
MHNNAGSQSTCFISQDHSHSATSGSSPGSRSLSTCRSVENLHIDDQEKNKPSSAKEGQILLQWQRIASSSSSPGWQQHLWHLHCSDEQEVQKGKAQDCIGSRTGREWFLCSNICRCPKHGSQPRADWHPANKF